MYYRDIRLNPDVEIPTPVLYNQMFNRFHKGLVLFGVGLISVSFPELGEDFGSLLRLHGSQADLEDFGVGWLGPMRRRVRVGAVRAAPIDAPRKVYRRHRPKTRGPSWARRYANRNQMDVGDVALPPSRWTPGPVIFLSSSSTGGRVPLRVIMEDETPRKILGLAGGAAAADGGEA